MIKTLKITSLFAVAATAGVVVFLGFFGLKGDEKVEKFLNSPGVVEAFKKLATKTNKSSDQISPLVKQARAFARIINPPPPPKSKSKSKKASPKKIAKAKPAPPKPKVTVNTKFKLLATCRYEKYPAKSMALLDMPAKGPKWFRQGEEVNHLVIEQITDGSIVLYKSGKENSKISMPVIKKKSLLKSEQTALSQPEPTVDLFSILKASAPAKEVRKIPKTVSKRSVSTIPKSKKRTLPRRKTRRIRTAPPKPTTEQRKTSIDDSISSIRNILGSSTEEDPGTDETQKTWMNLLKSLQSERQRLEEPENDPEEKNQNSIEKSEITESDTNNTKK